MATQKTTARLNEERIPVFFGKSDQDTLTVAQWIQRMEDLKRTWEWTDMVTYHKARLALFAKAASYISLQANENVDPEYTATWTWLQGSLRKRFGDADEEEIKHGLAAKEQVEHKLSKLNLGQNLRTTSSARQTSRKDEEITPKPATAPKQNPPVKKTTRTRPRGHKRTVIHKKRSEESLAPRPDAVPRTQQMEERAHATIQATTQAAIQATVQATFQAIPTLIKQLNQNQAETQTEDHSGRGRQRQNSQPPRDPAKYCQYCRKNGHGQLDCVKRKSDNAPCINVRGESYYPANERTQNTDRHPKNTRPTEVHQGSDFHPWV